MSLPKDMSVSDWAKNLIPAVEKRPPLYDHHLREHFDQSLIANLWSEVCEEIIPSWNQLTPSEKILKETKIQKKWKNLKTCFKRELNKRGWTKKGLKRRKYIYSDQLMFLLPTIKTKSNIYETSPNSDEDDNSNTDEPNSLNQQIKIKQERLTPDNIESPLLLLEEQEKPSNENYDGDKLFLLSLIPSFRKMTDKQKIEAKIEFLSTIQRITNL